MGHSFSSKEQVSFNFMVAVIICCDFGAQENKSLLLFPLFPHLSAMKWWDQIYILFKNIPFHDGLSQDIVHSSLCYTVGPCCSCTLCVIVYSYAVVFILQPRLVWCTHDLSSSTGLSALFKSVLTVLTILTLEPWDHVFILCWVSNLYRRFFCSTCCLFIFCLVE